MRFLLAVILLFCAVEMILSFPFRSNKLVAPKMSKLRATYTGFDDMLSKIETPVLVDFYAEVNLELPIFNLLFS